jgi:hypothetical protein
MAEARDPRTDISDLFGQQAAAFLLIEKNDGSAGNPSRPAAAMAAAASARPGSAAF